ncbi:sulfatase-like hydrolase/transferase [Alienimonas sp. DA493]|uniref:sulfatase-like hydrolase/transferase n=1 Tax=Alienimonas sp. DA493 TaxID=3373605 RepID=UPI003754D9C4
MRSNFLVRALSLFLLAPCTAFAEERPSDAAERPPNVVLIFADDLGYGDLGCYGATKLQTPNIDRLAAEGRRFTDAHSASAVCTPSRYALLTGEYPLRAMGGRGVWGPLPTNHELIIDTDALTIGKAFKNEGYATACLGKWHLGFGRGANDWQPPLRPGPQDLGFDYYFGVPLVNSGSPFVYVENDTIVGYDPDDPLVYGGKPPSPTPTFPEEASRKSPNRFGGALEAHRIYDDEKTGTLLTEKAVEFITENRERPFFLYFPTPNIHHPFTPAPRFKGTSQCGLYGDFVHELDWMVGEVLRSLEDNGLSDDTLVIFTSDNGGMLNRAGRDAFKAGHEINGDLLGFKFGAWEGGHRVPFIARWPGRIEPGTESDQLIGQVDLLATFMALTGQSDELPEGKDSVNLLPALTGDPEEPLRTELALMPHKPRNLALRRGKWMYIDAQGSGGFTGSRPHHHAWGGPAAVEFAGDVNSDIRDGRIKKDAPPAQLYDLEADPSQTTNLYRKSPQVVKEMQARLNAWRSPEATKETAQKDGGSAPAEAPQKDARGEAAPAATPAARVAPARNGAARADASKPNVVVIFADDLGYGDLSCYGPTGVETPHIDALAAEGFRSTDFFVPANVCSPSRAALLSGRYPMRCGMPVARHESEPKYSNYGFSPEEITIPELLGPAGYRSLMVGKWHLGMDVEGSHPIDAGFDEHLGIPSNYSSGRGPDYNTLFRGKQVEERDVPLTELTKRYTDEVVRFIERRKDQPFFIYFSHHIVHSPLKPREEFVGASRKGKYGDFIKELDHSTGRVMRALRDAGVDDDTVVVFTSDNGPTRFGSTGGLAGGKYCTMEGGHRVPAIVRWPGRIPAGQVSDTTVSSMDLLPLFCELAGVEQPNDRTIDGKNILPVLLGEETRSPHKFLYYYNGTNLQAVREGDWKLHLPRTPRDQPFWSKKRDPTKGFVTLDQPKLYNLEQDVRERHDVAAQRPEVVARLQKQADAIRAELGDVRTTGSDQREIDLEDPQER